MAHVYAGKNILVGITGSIAAYKVAGWVSTLTKAEARVSVVMTEAATRFVSPLTFSALSGEAVHTDMFAQDSADAMAHITLGQEADMVIVAPATAQTIARLAHGMADDLLSTTILACRAQVLICPAMNSRMYTHPATQDNIAKLRTFGYTVIEPGEGILACKEEGPGRLVEWEQVADILQKGLSPQDLHGQKVLVTAGPTREPIDPARFLSNRSSGKMGYALARAAYHRGAQVVLVSGPTSLAAPVGVERIVVESAEQMYRAVMEQGAASSVIIKAAAVADYRPDQVYTEKVKKEAVESRLELVPNRDILLELGQRKGPGQILVGFAAESANLEAEGRRKLKNKNLDLIAVNNINSDITGFEVDTNQVLLIDNQGAETLPHTSKEQTADLILDKIVALLSSRTTGKGGEN